MSWRECSSRLFLWALGQLRHVLAWFCISEYGSAVVYEWLRRCCLGCAELTRVRIRGCRRLSFVLNARFSGSFLLKQWRISQSLQYILAVCMLCRPILRCTVAQPRCQSTTARSILTTPRLRCLLRFRFASLTLHCIDRIVDATVCGWCASRARGAAVFADVRVPRHDRGCDDHIHRVPYLCQEVYVLVGSACRLAVVNVRELRCGRHWFVVWCLELSVPLKL